MDGWMDGWELDTRCIGFFKLDQLHVGSSRSFLFSFCGPFSRNVESCCFFWFSATTVPKDLFISEAFRKLLRNPTFTFVTD